MAKLNDQEFPGFGMGPGRGRRRGRGHRWIGDYSLVDVRLVEPALLAFLRKENLHGYALLEKLDTLGLGAISPSVIYRILRDYEEVGLVRSEWDTEESQGPPRRVYAITSQGRAALSRAADSLKQTVDRIEMILSQIVEE
jgi:DNA-binding PadR family transcriptional regulator